MDQSSPEHYPIADFIKWHAQKELELNPSFQRGPVWTDPAKSYLIDTILQGYPIPKVLMRTHIERSSHRIFREVVDGQQRLRTIIDFAADKFKLGARSKEFRGLNYSSLSHEMQDRFLAYKITAEQLINATDTDVLEVFARINSYTVPVNAAELRNATYDNEFSWSVQELSRKWTDLWDLGVLTKRDQVRMLGHSLVAEMYWILLNGVSDGGEPKIDRMYDRKRKEFIEKEEIEHQTNWVLDLMQGQVFPAVKGEPIVKRPQALMIFAALAHSRFGLEPGDVGDADMPARTENTLERLPLFVSNLTYLNEVLRSEEPPRELTSFYGHSKSSTQRIASRKDRFRVFCMALESSLES
ncbi:DUF262 domain-containing protein [Streptomyces sp. WMMC500]|uniref:DUF262 domain-containing protein n=1 Tax=Streptomyces sp. WMMC500 TaxID=3015154 RepID=UPI00248BE4E8|nr:DUF262 domain-containing protein [Streptomyces sp. WMMC500]WBB63976.1 DUF262 domain-containing protein [Streptomyces sp. WMMC500]